MTTLMLADATAQTTITVVPVRPLLFVTVIAWLGAIVFAHFAAAYGERLAAAESALSEARAELVQAHAALYQCQAETHGRIDALTKTLREEW